MPDQLIKEGITTAIVVSVVAIVFLLVNPIIKSDAVRFGAGGAATVIGFLLSDIAIKELFKDEN